MCVRKVVPPTRFGSQSFWGMREVVYNDMDLHGEVFTVKVLAVVCEGRRRPMLSMIWWEIEGFHLTVGNGCRKLGREMSLRRNGDSHLVNVEFEDELQGCKKPMSREMTHENSGVACHSATADVDENSDVAGYSAAAVVHERRVASSTIELPRCKAVESQSRLKFLLLHCIVHVSLEQSLEQCRSCPLDVFFSFNTTERATRSQLFRVTTTPRATLIR